MQNVQNGVLTLYTNKDDWQCAVFACWASYFFFFFLYIYNFFLRFSLIFLFSKANIILKIDSQIFC